MGNLYQSDITYELGKNFINYAAGVNTDRSIPDALTGLKPVARRILYIMQDEGVISSKPHKKCAKTVGSVIGRVHPHGDVAVYEAMVRLAQEWTMRYPLIDWHGNKGTQDGDGPAHQRYTESRLAKIAEEGLLSNLKKNNVDWQPNYSEDEEEPITLPSLFPNLLCNPNQGIGVAMSCHWGSHNLIEVGNLIIDYLSKGELNFDNMAPDFPTGGIIINGKELKQIYLTGKGKVVIRGKYNTIIRGKKNLIVFTEVPYGVKIEDLLDQINEACNKGLITGIDEVRNESDKKSLNIVFELSKDASEGQVLKQLFKESDLQKSISLNQVALVNKVPTLLNWKDCIDIYVNHNINIIEREASFDFQKALARVEIVNGLLKALEDIDNIVALIKASKSAAAAKDNLIEKYGFTEPQAKAIVDMKLGKLAGLEKIELNQEKADLDKKIEELDWIINHEEKRKEILVDKLSAFVKKFGDKRRTEVTHIEIKPEEKEIAEVVPEDCVVILTQTGDIKRVPLTSFKTQKRNGKGVKTEDNAILDTISTNTIDNLMLFTSEGKMFKLLVDNLPVGTNTSKGVKIETLINLEQNEKIVAMTSLHRKTNAEYVIFITKQGLIKKTCLEEYSKIKRSTGIAAIKLKEGDSLANVTFIKDEDMIVFTKNGMSIHFSTNDIAPIGRITSGVRAIKLNSDDEVVIGLPIHKNSDMVGVITSKGYGKKIALDEFPIQARGGKGVIVNKIENSGEIIGVCMIDNEDNLLLIGRPNSICFSAEELPLLSRGSLGNSLIKNSKVISVVKL